MVSKGGAIPSPSPPQQRQRVHSLLVETMLSARNHREFFVALGGVKESSLLQLLPLGVPPDQQPSPVQRYALKHLLPLPFPQHAVRRDGLQNPFFPRDTHPSQMSGQGSFRADVAAPLMHCPSQRLRVASSGDDFCEPPDAENELEGVGPTREDLAEDHSLHCPRVPLHSSMQHERGAPFLEEMGRVGCASLPIPLADELASECEGFEESP